MAAHHVLDVYGVHLHLLTKASELDDVRERIGCDADDLPDDTTHSLGSASSLTDEKTGDEHHVVWIDVKSRRHRRRADLIDTIAHECSHVADHVLQDRNVYGGEARAYLVGWLAGWVYQHCV